MQAAQAIAKYAGFIVLDHFAPESTYPLLVLRENIYTDPQKPIQVQPGLYEINGPGANDPLLVTTNFSITYFSVANEVESAGQPSWLLVTESEGMSVLTAWAAGKFDAERIAKDVKRFNVADKVSKHQVVLPGHRSGPLAAALMLDDDAARRQAIVELEALEEASARRRVSGEEVREPGPHPRAQLVELALLGAQPLFDPAARLFELAFGDHGAEQALVTMPVRPAWLQVDGSVRQAESVVEPSLAVLRERHADGSRHARPLFYEEPSGDRLGDRRVPVFGDHDFPGCRHRRLSGLRYCRCRRYCLRM